MGQAQCSVLGCRSVGPALSCMWLETGRDVRRSWKGRPHKRGNIWAASFRMKGKLL